MAVMLIPAHHSPIRNRKVMWSPPFVRLPIGLANFFHLDFSLLHPLGLETAFRTVVHVRPMLCWLKAGSTNDCLGLGAHIFSTVSRVSLLNSPSSIVSMSSRIPSSTLPPTLSFVGALRGRHDAPYCHLQVSAIPTHLLIF